MEKKEYDYKESKLPENKQGRLNELRIIQIEREFAPDELGEFKRLTEEEEKKGLSSEEEKEYLFLTRRQTDSKNWTPDDARRLQELIKKIK